jgi:hypothetical protein
VCQSIFLKPKNGNRYYQTWCRPGARRGLVVSSPHANTGHFGIFFLFWYFVPRKIWQLWSLCMGREIIESGLGICGSLFIEKRLQNQNQCCQIVWFISKTNSDIIWRALEWKMSIYFMEYFMVLGFLVSIWYILWPFGVFCGHSVYFVAIRCILWPFGIFWGHLEYFWPFCIFLAILYILWNNGIFSTFGYVCRSKKNPV